MTVGVPRISSLGVSFFSRIEMLESLESFIDDQVAWTPETENAE